MTDKKVFIVTDDEDDIVFTLVADDLTSVCNYLNMEYQSGNDPLDINQQYKNILHVNPEIAQYLEYLYNTNICDFLREIGYYVQEENRSKYVML